MNRTLSPVFTFDLRRYAMPEKDLRPIAAEIALYTDVSIDKVQQTVSTFGKVHVIYVTPYKRNDPPILFIRGQAEALRKYYKLWRDLHSGNFVIFLKWRFNRAVDHFLKHARLSDQEKAFALQQFTILYNEKGLRQ